MLFRRPYAEFRKRRSGLNSSSSCVIWVKLIMECCYHEIGDANPLFYKLKKKRQTEVQKSRITCLKLHSNVNFLNLHFLKMRKIKSILARGS